MSLSGDRPQYIRINTLSVSIKKALDAFSDEGWILLPRCENYLEYLKVVSHLNGKYFIRDYHISELLAFPPGTIFYDHPGYKNKKFVLQDKGNCLPSFLLNPKPGSNVIQVGTKSGQESNHLACIMENKGAVHTLEVIPDRHKHLCDLLELSNSSCVEPLLRDFMKINPKEFPNVQYILIDSSYMDYGMFELEYKCDSAEKILLKRRLEKLCIALKHALHHFPTVKRVVYTTNSHFKEKNEIIIEQALESIGECYSLLDVKEMLWDQWESLGSSKYLGGSKCLFSDKDFDMCETYFVAVFERNFDLPLPIYKMPDLNKLNNLIRNEGFESDSEVEIIEIISNNKKSATVEKKVSKIDQLPSNKHKKESLISYQKKEPCQKSNEDAVINRQNHVTQSKFQQLYNQRHPPLLSTPVCQPVSQLTQGPVRPTITQPVHDAAQLLEHRSNQPQITQIIHQTMLHTSVPLEMHATLQQGNPVSLHQPPVHHEIQQPNHNHRPPLLQHPIQQHMQPPFHYQMQQPAQPLAHCQIQHPMNPISNHQAQQSIYPSTHLQYHSNFEQIPHPISNEMQEIHLQSQQPCFSKMVPNHFHQKVQNNFKSKFPGKTSVNEFPIKKVNTFKKKKIVNPYNIKII